MSVSNGETEPAADSGLRTGTLPMSSVVALGLAYMSLAPVIFFNFGYISSSAGGPTAPIIFIIVTVAILPTAVSFAELNRRRPSAGSVSTWVGESLGGLLGAWTGWLQTSLYVVGCAIYPAYFSVFFNPFLEYFGIQSSYLTSALASVGICVLIAFLLRREIEAGAKSVIILVVIVAAFVLGLAFYIMVRQFSNGNVPDPIAPFDLSYAAGGSSGVMLALVFGVLSLAGVDAVAPVAEEAENPRRDIPRATYCVLFGASLFCVVASYGFSIAVPFDTLAGYVDAGLLTPIYPIAEQYIGWASILVPIIGLTAVMAGFGAFAVCASRLLFNQARAGNAPRSLSITHPRYGSPWNASKPVLVFCLIAPIAVGMWLDYSAGASAAWLGGIFVYFALVTYLLANVANIVWHLRNARAEFNWLRNGVFPALGILVVLYMLYEAFFVAYLGGPFKTGSSIVYISLLWTVIGAAWAVRVWRRNTTSTAQPGHTTPTTTVVDTDR